MTSYFAPFAMSAAAVLAMTLAAMPAQADLAPGVSAAIDACATPELPHADRIAALAGLGYVPVTGEERTAAFAAGDVVIAFNAAGSTRVSNKNPDFGALWARANSSSKTLSRMKVSKLTLGIDVLKLPGESGDATAIVVSTISDSYCWLMFPADIPSADFEQTLGTPRSVMEYDFGSIAIYAQDGRSGHLQLARPVASAFVPLLGTEPPALTLYFSQIPARRPATSP